MGSGQAWTGSPLRQASVAEVQTLVSCARSPPSFAVPKGEPAGAVETESVGPGGPAERASPGGQTHPAVPPAGGTAWPLMGAAGGTVLSHEVEIAWPPVGFAGGTVWFPEGEIA